MDEDDARDVQVIWPPTLTLMNLSPAPPAGRASHRQYGGRD